MFLTVLPVAPDILLVRPSSRSVTTETRSAIADTKPCSCSPSRFQSKLASEGLGTALVMRIGTGSHISLSFDLLARHSVDAAGTGLLALPAACFGMPLALRT